MSKSTDAKTHLLDWLRNAHAMEKQAETLLTATAKRLEHYPDLRSRIEQHAIETQGQAEMLEGRIVALGGDTSGVKDFMASAMATFHAMGNAVQPDEVVKAAGFSYAFEHFEIAQYRTLIATAEAIGDSETAEVCRDILAQEEEMAQWCLDHLEPTVLRFLERSETPELTAKR